MPNPLAITPVPEADYAANFTGEAIDIGLLRTYLTLTLNVASVGSAGSYVMETSANEVAWVPLAASALIPAAGVTEVAAHSCKRYVRVRLTGVTGTYHLSIAGEAHVLYAEPGDIPRFAIPEHAIAHIPLDVRAAKCLLASVEAEGDLAKAFGMPLTKWSLDVRKHVACMAAYEMMMQTGWDPDSPMDKMLEKRHEDAMDFFSGLAKEKKLPPGIEDTTPEEQEAAGDAYVYSGSGGNRGWEPM